MTLEELLANLTDIKSNTTPPYYIGKHLSRQLQDRCSGYRATTDGDGVDTARYDGIDGLQNIEFVLMEYPSEKGVPNELDTFFGTIGPDKVLNEIKVE
jgi:hypothetical protein